MHVNNIFACICLLGLTNALVPRQSTPTCGVQPKSPQPSGSTCGQTGMIVNPAILSTPTASTQTACRDFCWKDSRCLSFSYETANSKCTLYTKSMADQATATSWWDKSCYQDTCPSPDSCNNRGVEWAKYANTRNDGTNNWGSDSTYSSFEPAIVKNRIPGYEGTTTYIGFTDTNVNSNAFIYDSDVRTNQDFYILNHRFYIYAPENGQYKLDFTYVDDIACAWIGSNAYKGYTRANANKCVIVSSNDVKTLTFELTANKYWPIRIIYGNAQAAAGFNASITSPSGRVLLDSKNSTSNIIQKGCDGKTPTWPDFGNES